MSLKSLISLPKSHLLESVLSFSIKDVLQIACGSLLLALSAQVSLPLPFTSVPLTLQTFTVLFLGLSLGSKKGALAVAAYLGEAACGLPVLAGGNTFFSILAFPRTGYLAGMFFQAYIFGRLTENQTVFSFFKTVFAGTFASLVQLSIGALWLGMFVGAKNAFMLGLYPFILMELFKVITIASLKKLS